MPGQVFTQYFLSEGIRTTSEWEVRWTPIVGQDRGGNRLYQHRDVSLLTRFSCPVRSSRMNPRRLSVVKVFGSLEYRLPGCRLHSPIVLRI